MLTKLTIRNFKQLKDNEIELGDNVVFIGPNNSGKTSALQALSMWYIGLQTWSEKRRGRNIPHNRPGVAISREALYAVPVLDTDALWFNRRASRTGSKIEIEVEGIEAEQIWSCGLEFRYANEESLYCEPLHRSSVPAEAYEVKVAFLPAMSGIVLREQLLQFGAVNVLVGEGQTAQALRNLCYYLATNKPDEWLKVKDRMKKLFAVNIDDPVYVPVRGEVRMGYRTRADIQLDISAAGRGQLQTLLLLVYLYANPGTVLLLDEPDAHLEVLRQRQIYNVVVATAGEQGGQVIAASHSEVVLDEAADRDIVISFVGKPHRMDNRSDLAKALKEIDPEDYYQAEQRGWVLYVEDATDLDILQAFAAQLNHPAQQPLASPFVYYLRSNNPDKARSHFYGMREAKPNLVAFLLTDHTKLTPRGGPGLTEHMWQRCEIENYLTQQATLLNWARGAGSSSELGADYWANTMEESIAELERAFELANQPSPWSPERKASDTFLDPLFRNFYRKLGLYNMMKKSNFHVLAAFVPKQDIDQEVIGVLDHIAEVASKAKPVEE